MGGEIEMRKMRNYIVTGVLAYYDQETEEKEFKTHYGNQCAWSKEEAIEKVVKEYQAKGYMVLDFRVGEIYSFFDQVPTKYKEGF